MCAWAYRLQELGHPGMNQPHGLRSELDRQPIQNCERKNSILPADQLLTSSTRTAASQVARFIHLPFPDKINVLHRQWRKLIGIVYYRHVFASFGSGSVLYKPVFLSNCHLIYVGKNVLIRQGARLEGVIMDPTHPPELHIGNNVNIEQDAQIVFIGKVIIEDDVSITARCVLLSGHHPFLDVEGCVKIGARLSGADSITKIGAGSFLGANTVVQSGVTIGKRAVIGAGSVVKKDVPDYSVADGNPAAIIMQFDQEQRRWTVPRKI